ncbi:MAG: ABC transporter permease [Candidatus Eisenbacteria bacterium]|nr:ABC transporter permease [Candidatus Eisenbacteria bacterium]
MTDGDLDPTGVADAADADRLGHLPGLSPWGIFWRQFRRSPLAVAGAALLGFFYTVALFAPFIAPYGEADMDRERFFHPPHALHWIDPHGRWHLVPFVHPTRDAGGQAFVEDRTRVVPIRWFTHGAKYRLFGLIPTDRHLFGVDPPDRIFLWGADTSGRDVFSRVLYGAQISLTVGLVGLVISFTIGMMLGGIAGYLGGWADATIMRATELLLSIPALYLIIALRGIFPPTLSSQQIYLGIVAILAFIGWAGLARVIRGMVLSIRRQEYVAAAEALGMSRLRVVARHILPNTLSFVIVAATITIPGYILGEIFLSFLAVGVQEPAASWGNMLNAARSQSVMISFPWMLIAPAAAIFVTVMAFNLLGDGLRDALDPRRVMGGKSG